MCERLSMMLNWFDIRTVAGSTGLTCGIANTLTHIHGTRLNTLPHMCFREPVVRANTTHTCRQSMYVNKIGRVVAEFVTDW